ncbi:hypothetical protein M569_15256 [Genlisea aurea]|uniref:Heme O synthase n=1 Tax=Genlisea aurea TaxID=192259 RepID=S8BYS2_9LAMI|nr:hypothetical protein M569_15256 [Genlisea aurea]
MWVRNAVTVSSKLVGGRGTNSLFRVCGFSPISHHRGGCFRANSTSSAGDLVNWAQSGADAQFSGRRLTSSVSASFIDAADSSLKAKEILEMAKNYGRCYWELSKARLSMLVVATSGTGYIMGSGSSVDYLGLCFTCAGTMMVAASANSLNQVFEVKNDALMNRTKNRPLPSGRITVPHALTWGSSVGLAGTALLASQANMLAAGLAASNLVLYAFVYTPLKQIHPVNTWIGAVVGAIPPLLG